MASALAVNRTPATALEKDPFLSFKRTIGPNRLLPVEPIDKGFSQYVLSRVQLNTSQLSARKKSCLRELILAGNAIDSMLYRQLTPHGLEIKELFEEALPYIGEKELKRRVLEYYHYLKINHGYYDDANGKRKFVPSFSQSEFLSEINPRRAVSEKEEAVLRDLRARFLTLSDEMYLHKGEERPPGVEFYPKSLRAGDIDASIRLAKAERPASLTFVRDMESPYAVVKGRRNRNSPGGWSLRPVGYNREFAAELQVVSEHMNKAASIIGPEDKKFARYLRERAKALLSGRKCDFERTDILWLQLDHPVINFVIGPIESYDDKILGIKTSFQAYLTIKNAPPTKRAQRFRALMPDIVATLPCEEKYKNKPDEAPPILDFVDAVGIFGAVNRTATTVAFSLPNDPNFRTKNGSRSTQVLNILDAKSSGTTIKNEILKFVDPEIASRFTQKELDDGDTMRVMFHECSHPLGLCLDANGKIIDSRIPLGDFHDPFEEMKANVLASHWASVAFQKGMLSAKELETIGMDRLLEAIKWAYSQRNPTSDHAKASLMEFNYLFDQENGAIFLKDGKYSINFQRMAELERELAGKLLDIQGKGDKKAAKEFIEKYAKVPEHMKPVLAHLDSTGLPKFVYPVLPDKI